jgi:hypothetical protein
MTDEDILARVKVLVDEEHSLTGQPNAESGGASSNN